MPLLAAAICLALPPGTGAEEGDPPPAPRARAERITSELVLIETYVNDLKGRPIRGLGPEDFVLMIDGKVAQIASLEFRVIGPGPGEPPSPGGPAAGGTAPSVPGPPPRRFMLFFEDDTSSPLGLTVARQAAGEFIATRLLPTDQVALVEHGRTLRPLSDFTTDHQALLRRLDESTRDRSRVSGFFSELVDREMELRRVTGESRLLSFLFSSYATQDAQRYQRSISALRTAIDVLAPWPGYKAIVFLGDGIPDNPGRYYLERLRDAPGIGKILGELHSAARKADLSFEMKGLIDAAGAAGVTMHTIATGGLVADPEAGRPPQQGRGVAAGFGGGAAATLADSVRADSLKTIAFNTGGVSSHSNDALRGLTEAEASSRAYYILGYAPEGPPDGRSHTVQVRVRRITAELRWRRGFTRLLPEEARARDVQAAYLLPELYAAGGVEVVLVPGPAEGPGRIADLVLYVPPGRVLFLPEEGRPAARLEVGLTVLDGSARETLRLARSLRIAWPGREPGQPGVGLNLVHRLRLPDAAQSVTAVVGDLASRSLWSARLQVPAVRAGDDPISGLSIYSRSENSLWVEIEAPGEAPAETEEVVYATVGPALKATFSLGEPLLCGFRLPRGGKETLLRLVLHSGERLIGELRIDPAMATDEGVLKHPLPIEDLPGGDYRLVVQELGPAPPIERGGFSFQVAAPRPATPHPGPGAP